MSRRKKSLSYLSTLIHKLSSPEIKNIKLYLKCFDPNFDDEHKVKTLELLELILEEGENYNEDRIISRLYPEGGQAGFKYLRLRLRQKVQESLLMSVNIERKGFYSDFSKVSIEVRKSLLQLQILWGRNITYDLLSLLGRIIRKATQYELYPELLEALYLKQQYLGFREGKKVYEKIQKEIEIAEENLKAVRQAKHYYSQMIIENASRAGRPTGAVEIEKKREILAQDMKRNPSANISWYHHHFDLELAQLGKDYKKSKEICQKLIRLLHDSPAIFTQRRLGMVYGQLANVELLNHNPEGGVDYARKSQKYFPPGSINHCMSGELAFYGYYYQKKYTEAEKIMRKLLSKEDLSQTDQQFQRRSYLFASLLFQQGQFLEAHNHLNNTSLMLSDKEGWNIGIRILNIQIQIERNLLHEIELQVDSLGKLIQRLVKKRLMTRRYQAVLKLLSKLVKHSFDFKKVAKLNRAELELLASDDPNYHWEIKGPEMVVFHLWFQSKLG